MGFFKIKSKNSLDQMNVGDVINESDFATLTPSGVFVQLEYIEEDTTIHEYDVKPGIFAIQKTSAGLRLEPTSFVKDAILDSFVHTEHITEKIDCFFRNLHKYKEFGIEVPSRKMMLYGPPGVGKSTAINKIAEDYTKDGKTLIIVWPTDKFEAYQVKDFVKSFKYVNVDKMILIIEDLGGVEIDQVRMKSDSSLLSLLDNQEKTFKIPVLMLATTNFIEVFMGNLTNRPGRFDDKIKVSYPDGDSRAKLLTFFNKATLAQPVRELVSSSSCQEFSTAHLKEVIIRSVIYEKNMVDVIKELIEEIKTYKKAFVKTSSMGIGMLDDD